nr:sec14p-like phosphatidylinositol transfer family protein [Tanacetum cinerariifolium]
LLDTENTDKNSSFYDESNMEVKSIISESTSRNASIEPVSSSVFQSHVPRRSMSLQLRVNKPPLPNNTRVEPEVHEGACGMHVGARSVVAKIMRQGYYWPTMHEDTKEVVDRILKQIPLSLPCDFLFQQARKRINEKERIKDE